MKDKLGMSDVEEFVANMEKESILKLAGSGCSVYRAVSKPESILFVQPGWLLIEQVISGVLVYGFRRSCILASTKAAENYESLIGLASVDGKETTKMKEVLELLKLPEAL